MRILVVLLLFYLDLAIGLIDPSEIPELLRGIITPTPKNARINLTDILEKTELKPFQKNLLEESKTSINGAIAESMYENIKIKENNISERSFVFINQRFKTRNHFLNMMSQSPRSSGDKSFLIGEDNTRFHELKNRFFPGNPKSFITNNNIHEASMLYCDPPYQCSDNAQDTFRQIQDQSDKIYLNNIHGERRDYMELLKPPIIRSENNPNPEVKDDKIFLTASQFNRPLSTYSKYTSNIQVNPSDSPHEANFSPVLNKQIFSGNDVVYKTQKYEEVNDNNEQKELSVEDDKLLDKYLQEKMVKEGKTLKYDECNYRDCVTKSAINSLAKKKNKKPECQCANKLNLKNPKKKLSSKDRPERAHYYKGTSIPVFPDNSEELVNEEDDVVKVINKINDALRL